MVKSLSVRISDDCWWGRAFSCCEWLVLIINLLDSRVTWEMNPWMIILVNWWEMTGPPITQSTHHRSPFPCGFPLVSQKDLWAYVVPVAVLCSTVLQARSLAELVVLKLRTDLYKSVLWDLKSALKLLTHFLPPISSRPGTAFSPRELWNDWWTGSHGLTLGDCETPVCAWYLWTAEVWRVGFLHTVSASGCSMKCLSKPGKYPRAFCSFESTKA